MAKTTISLSIPKSAAERAARSVLFDILGQYRVGDINHEQATEAIEHWRTSVNASLEGDAVERVARIIDPEAFEDDRLTWEDRRVRALNRARRILATGLVAGEAAIRADEREKCATLIERRPGRIPNRQEIAAAIRSGGGE